VKARTLVACLVLFSLAAGPWTLASPAATAVQAADPLHPDRQGAWLDSLVFSEQGSASAAISQLQADELDVYAYSVSDPALFQRVLEDPNLTYTESYGSYNELTFNPSGPEFNDGRLNPFSNAAIREAMNWLIDRNYIAQEIFSGSATPRWLPLLHIDADYARYQSTIEGLEAAYAYDLPQAQQAIAAEMLAMGATQVGGIWHYNGQPVSVIFIIRVEDARRQIGDYVADQLEQIGFAVDRQYKTRSQASPIWNQSDPAEGQWHLYTGGWITTAVSRDDATNFGYFYTPLGSGSPLWQAYQPSPEFYAVCEALWTNDFTTMEERAALFEQALLLSMEDSARVWLVDQTSFTPRRAETTVASDLAGGVAGSSMWPYVARFEGVEGGSMRIAQPGLLVEPWNPIAGSNWLYDQMPIRATQDYGVITDPNTGLYWPQRVESADCVAKAGLPVTKTLDWVDLSFAPVITVPADAWADWNATSQTFIAAGNMPTPTLEANTMCTVTYPIDLFTTVTWHDGSPLDLSDFVMRLILQFDRGKPESAIYDESAVDSMNAFLSHFRGVKIQSTNPLVITTWDDQLYLDAEWLAQAMTWWPSYSQGPGAWHNLATGIRAEAAGELALSADKAGQLGVEWMSFVGGDSLVILEDWMDLSAVQHYIPYAATLGAYVTQAEADARWAALQAWYTARGHFWLGTGPFYVDQVSLDPKALTLAHYAAFPDLAGRWDAFAAGAQPQIAINHTTGAPGSYFNVTGTGFPPDETAFIVVNGQLLDDLPVDAGGAISFTLTTGAADPGVYHVRVSVNPAAGVQFTLDETEPVQPREGDFPLVIVPDGLITYYAYLPIVVRNHDVLLLYFDDFSDPNSGWLIEEGDWGHVGYYDGEYEMSSNEGWWGVDSSAPINDVPASFSLEADVRFVSGTENAYGLKLSTPEGTAYDFYVKPVDQRWALSYYDGSQWGDLAAGNSAYINQGTATNHLKVVVKSNNVALYANDHLLGSDGSTTLSSAWTHLVLWSHTGSAAARYDSFAVRRLLGGGLATGVQPY